MLPFVSDLHLVSCFQGSSMSCHVSGRHSFLSPIISRCMDGPHCIHSSADGHLGCVHRSAIVRNAAVNVCTSVCVDMGFNVDTYQIFVFFPVHHIQKLVMPVGPLTVAVALPGLCFNVNTCFICSDYRVCGERRYFESIRLSCSSLNFQTVLFVSFEWILPE